MKWNAEKEKISYLPFFVKKKINLIQNDILYFSYLRLVSAFFSKNLSASIIHFGSKFCFSVVYSSPAIDDKSFFQLNLLNWLTLKVNLIQDGHQNQLNTESTKNVNWADDEHNLWHFSLKSWH